jgi:hypothetical protein
MKKSVLGALVVFAFVALGMAAAPTLTFTFTDVHANKTATETDSFAVNNSGVIAGDYVDAKSVQHAMILSGTKLTTVNHSDCATTGGFADGAIAFYGINSAGAAAGWCTSTSTGLYTGFVYSKGKFTSIDFPKSNGTQAIGINDKGDVVGLYLDSSNTQHGYSKIGSKYTSFDVSGAEDAEGWDINDKGEMAVFAISTAGGSVSYIYNGKKFTQIKDPNEGSDGTIIRSIDNNGDIAGTYFNSSGDEIGFLLYKGTYYDVADPKADNDTRADGLNDKLEIVGRYENSADDTIGFKATTKQ